MAYTVLLCVIFALVPCVITEETCTVHKVVKTESPFTTLAPGWLNKTHVTPMGTNNTYTANVSMTTSVPDCPVQLPCTCREHMESYYRYFFLPDMTGVHLRCVQSNLTTSSIPAIIATNITVASLHISDNENLEDLPAYYLVNLTGVRLIDLSKNAFREVPSTVSNVSGLHTLFLDRNQIDLHESSKAFHSLTDLRFLDLSHNNISVLPEGIFKGLKHLESLLLVNNSILELHEDLFTDLRHMFNIRLDNNKIKTLRKDMFRGLGSLLSLRIKANEITYIGPEVFVYLFKLELIDLSKNEISMLHRNAFKGLRNLAAVYLDSNKLVTLSPGLFGDSRYLSLLSLENNSLDTTSMRFEVFRDISLSLQALFLGYNKIFGFPGYFFTTFVLMEILSLRGLPLRTLPDLSQNFNLQYLFLTGTNITHIYPCDLPILKVLKILDWGDSSLTCDCNIRWLNEWYKDNPKEVHMFDKIRIGSPTTTVVNMMYYQVSDPKCKTPLKNKGKQLKTLLPKDISCEHGLAKSNWCQDVTHPEIPQILFTATATSPTEISTHWNVTNSYYLQVYYVAISYSSNATQVKPKRHILEQGISSYDIPKVSPGYVYHVCIELIGRNNFIVAHTCQYVRTPVVSSNSSVAVASTVPVVLIILALVALGLVLKRFKQQENNGRINEFENPNFDAACALPQEQDEGKTETEMSSV